MIEASCFSQRRPIVEDLPFVPEKGRRDSSVEKMLDGHTDEPHRGVLTAADAAFPVPQIASFHRNPLSPSGFRPVPQDHTQVAT